MTRTVYFTLFWFFHLPLFDTNLLICVQIFLIKLCINFAALYCIYELYFQQNNRSSIELIAQFLIHSLIKRKIIFFRTKPLVNIVVVTFTSENTPTHKNGKVSKLNDYRVLYFSISSTFRTFIQKFKCPCDSSSMNKTHKSTDRQTQRVCNRSREITKKNSRKIPNKAKKIKTKNTN